MAEITFKTDPKNMDYEVEHGATPNFKALKIAEQQAVQEEKDRQEEEKLNPMKLLENRTKQSRREMENLEALEDLKELNQRNKDLVFENPVNFGEQLVRQMTAEERQQAIDREFEAEEQQLLSQLNGSNKQLDDSSGDDDDDEVLPKYGITFAAKDKDFTQSKDNLSKDADNSSKNQMKRKINQLVVVKKKAKNEDNFETNTTKTTDNSEKTVNNNKNSNNLLNLCAYSSSDDE